MDLSDETHQTKVKEDMYKTTKDLKATQDIIKEKSAQRYGDHSRIS